MPSARAKPRIVGLGLLTMVTLSACSTTQQEAARLQLNAARVRAGQVRTVVGAGATSRTVRVTALTVLAGTYLVTVRNTGRSPVSDLPISTGYISRTGRRVVLNGLPTEYFGNHLPVILPGRSITWVAAASTRLPARARPFAAVGARAPESVTPGSVLPSIHVEHVRALRGGRLVALSLVNATSVPQYQMPIYVLGHVDGRLSAAGSVLVEHLGSHGSEALSVPLVGQLGTSAPSVEALPTIFH